MEKIISIVKIDDNDLGYKITTDKQVVSVLIDNVGGCCEDWGFITTEDSIQDFVGTELFGLEIVDTDYKNHPLTIDNNQFDSCDMNACFVDLLTSRGRLQFVLYNEHNGYYGHAVSIVSNQLNYSTIL